MADTGYNWAGAWSFMQMGAADWNGEDITDDAAPQVGDPVSMDGLAALEISIEIEEDNAGAINGLVTISILGDINGVNYEAAGAVGNPSIDDPWLWKIQPVQGANVQVRFVILGSEYTSFRLAVLNESGQTLDISVRQKAATIPLAT